MHVLEKVFLTSKPHQIPHANEANYGIRKNEWKWKEESRNELRGVQEINRMWERNDRAQEKKDRVQHPVVLV